MKEIIQGLDELGFDIGSVNEVILITVNLDGTPNAAAMGVRRIGQETLEIRPFKTSSTYGNLLRHPRACINVTGDPTLFLTATFKNEHLRSFQRPRIDGSLRLDASDAYVYVDVLGSRDTSEDRSSFTCRASSVEVIRALPRVFSRGRSEAIEAIIHATRVEVFMREGRLELVERLIKRFDACKDVVTRVSAPDSKEAMVIQELERLIGIWGEGASR